MFHFSCMAANEDSGFVFHAFGDSKDEVVRSVCKQFEHFELYEYTMDGKPLHERRIKALRDIQTVVERCIVEKASEVVLVPF